MNWSRSGKARLRKINKALIAAAACGFFALACLPYARTETINKIIAVVNGEVITQGELDTLVIPMYQKLKERYTEAELPGEMAGIRKEVLNRLIEEKLIISEAKKLGIEVTEDEINKKVAEVKQRFKTEEEFNAAMNEQGISPSELREIYTNRIMSAKLLDARVNNKAVVKPAEINMYFETHKEDFAGSNKVKLKVIFIKAGEELAREEAEELADEILGRIRLEGADFDEMAKKYSKGPNADNGGDMGYRSEGELLKEIEQEVFRLGEGQVSNVIATEPGFYIFKVVDKKRTKDRELSEVSEQIEKLLYREKFNAAYQKWVDELKKDAFISFK
ncbi:MAG: peptidylprolyl isomerase [Candidatus Omnitrophota bacterium]